LTTVTIPCLVCNAPIATDIATMKAMKKPAAICRECFGKTTATSIKTIYLLRTQLGELQQKVDILTANQESLTKHVGELREYMAVHVEQLYNAVEQFEVVEE
jgi:hypothetical protein